MGNWALQLETEAMYSTGGERAKGVTKREGRGLLPLPSASNATSHSRGGLILGFTGVGDIPRSERSKSSHFSASAKNGSVLNASDIFDGHAPSLQVS